jgi:hypothetical protein
MLDNSEHLVPGNTVPKFTVHPTWMCTESNWNWSRIIIPWLMNCQEDASIERIFILVAKKKGNPPLKVLVNNLCKPSPRHPDGFPIYIHGVDNQDSRVQGKKIIITTWHASKGMQCDAAAVLGIDWESRHNPLHVALTRSRGHLLMVQDKQKPNARLAVAAQRAPFGVVRVDTSTLQVDLENISIPLESDESQTELIRNLDVWSPRGRCARLHDLIVDVEVTQGEESSCSSFVQEITRGTWADVSRYYERAAKMKYEFDVTGSCKFLEFMKNPKRVTREAFDNNLKTSEQSYMLTGRATRHEILPSFAWEMLSLSLGKHVKTTMDWMTIAVCAESWNEFHHNLRQLLPCTWMEARVLENAVAILYKHLSPCDCIDSRLLREEGGVLFTCRCFASSQSTAWTIIYEDSISRSTRLLAAIPLSLHPIAMYSAILNMKTGEKRKFLLKSKSEFLCAL